MTSLASFFLEESLVFPKVVIHAMPQGSVRPCVKSDQVGKRIGAPCTRWVVLPISKLYVETQPPRGLNLETGLWVSLRLNEVVKMGP